VSILTLVIVGLSLLAIVSLLALVYAITHAEEGFEDSTGFHRTAPAKAAPEVSATVDTGNPWDQVEGASCPLDLGQPFSPVGQQNFSPHQP
jgi:hypothetical protein